MFGSTPDAQQQQQFSPPEDNPASTNKFHDIVSMRNILDSRYYSPASLRGLPPPIPNDLPAHLEDDVFTFEDAFEDLLAVTQGQPLPDIEHRYNQRRLLWQMFPDGEPRWFFERRLHASGLLRVPTLPQVQQQYQDKGHDTADWNDLHRQLQEKADEVWDRRRKHPSSSGDSDDEPQLDPWTDGLLADTMRFLVRLAGEDESRKVMSEVKKALEREFGQQRFETVLRDVRDEKELPSYKSQQDQIEGRQDRLPDTFDELFSHVKSAFDTGERSWKTLMKTIAKSEEEASPDHKPKRLVDYDDHVDEHGNTHHKMTVRVFDSDGNEVSKYTTHQVFQKWEPSKPDSGTSPMHVDGRGVEPVVESDKKAWFWKR